MTDPKEPHAIEILRERASQLESDLAIIKKNPHSIRVEIYQNYMNEIRQINRSIDYFMRRGRS